MRPTLRTILPVILVSTVVAQSAQGATVAMRDSKYNCAYVNENIQSDTQLQSFMIDYTLGMVTGMNIQVLIQGEPGFDFDRVDNAMFVTWAAQVCSANPEMTYAEAVTRMFDAVRTQADQQPAEGAASE